MEITIKVGILTVLVSQVFGRSLLSSVISTNATSQRNFTDEYVNEEFLTSAECVTRYHQHYLFKGCELVQVDELGCPLSYKCVSRPVPMAQPKVCTYAGKDYRVGERIQVRDQCKVCRCVGQSNPSISCLQRECPQLDYVEGRNCHLVYAKNKCCPIGFQCEEDLSYSENDVETTVSSCYHDGVNYPLGAKIYPSSDPCLVCDCNSNWNGIDGSSCYQRDCELEITKNMHLLEKGCIPIYHVSKCCPIEFYCPNNLENSVPENESLSSEDPWIASEKCFFDGVPYNVGDELVTDNPCVACRCVVPPDFTCIHQNCPRSLHSKKCHAHYNDTQCCPIYQCPLTHDTMVETSVGDISANDTAEEANFEILKEPSTEKTEILEEPSAEKPEILGEPSKEKTEILEEPSTEKPEILEEPSTDKTEIVEEPSTEKSEIDEISDNEIDVDNEISFLGSRRRRSESVGTQQQWHVLQQDQTNYDSSEPGGREREGPDGSNENYDEIKILRPKNSAPLVELDEEEFEIVNWTTDVAGCPAPMCADSTCRIGIPPGRTCPTCICKKRKNRQP